MMVLPSENILCQRKACALDFASSPKAYWSFPCVVVALSPSLTQKKMAYCWAVFCASIFVTRFTNTSWHVRHLLHIESLQRHATASKDRERIKVNGCLCWWAAVLSVQQKKISRITLLSDLVQLLVLINWIYYHPLSLLSWNSTVRADGGRSGYSIPEAVITFVRAPDDGCQHPKHVELPTEI